MLLEIRIFRCELWLFYIFINAICCCCAWLTWLRGCAVEVSKEVDSRWLLEPCLSTLGYVCREFFHFANSKTSSPLPPHLHPQKSHFIRKQTARWFRFIFMIFLKLLLCGPNARRKFALFFLGPRVLPASVCFTPSWRAAA